MNNGEEINITENRNLTVLGEDVIQVEDNNFKIQKHPIDNSNQVNIQIKLTGKEDQVKIVKQAIQLNFNGPLLINAAGKNGSNGAAGKDKNDAVVFRDGSDGARGENGENGMNGDNLSIHVWKENDSIRVHVMNVNTSSVWKYRTPITEQITINVSGGDGGNGGNGGDGGDGKDGFVNEDKNKLPGDGGNGASGGNGGNGGNPGLLQVVFHENIKTLKNSFVYINQPGSGGTGGSGGKAGKAGVPAEGQQAAKNGSNGASGANGQNGDNNQNPTISVENFDFSSYH